MKFSYEIVVSHDVKRKQQKRYKDATLHVTGNSAVIIDPSGATVTSFSVSAPFKLMWDTKDEGDEILVSGTHVIQTPDPARPRFDASRAKPVPAMEELKAPEQRTLLPKMVIQPLAPLRRCTPTPVVREFDEFAPAFGGCEGRGAKRRATEFENDGTGPRSVWTVPQAASSETSSLDSDPFQMEEHAATGGGPAEGQVPPPDARGADDGAVAPDKFSPEQHGETEPVEEDGPLIQEVAPAGAEAPADASSSDISDLDGVF